MVAGMWRQLSRRGLQRAQTQVQAQTQTALARARGFSASSPAPTAAKGPPFKKYLLYTTGIMFGVPGVVGAIFVYNLQTDDEFYNHFNDRYPDLIEAINTYVPLDESALELAERDDIGSVESPEELLHETVTMVAQLASGEEVRFEVPGSASQQEIEALALQRSSRPDTDRVVAFTFAEEGEEATARAPAMPTSAAWPPEPRVTWGSTAKAIKKLPKESPAQLRAEIESIRAQQAALEESKFAGRDVDEVDEEIQALEERKVALKARLPRKRFLYIF